MRFRTEYLGQVIQRRREIAQLPDLKLGELVLIGDDVQKRLNWPLAKIVDIIPEKDGKIRTLRLKTEHVVVIRPKQQVFPLELSPTNFYPSPFQLENSYQGALMGTDSSELLTESVPCF